MWSPMRPLYKTVVPLYVTPASRAKANAVLSCPVQSCPVLACPVLCCLVLSCPIQSYPLRSCPVLSCPVLSCPVLSSPVLSHAVLSCPVLSCPVDTRSCGHKQASSSNLFATKAAGTSNCCPVLSYGASLSRIVFVDAAPQMLSADLPSGQD